MTQIICTVAVTLLGLIVGSALATWALSRRR
jgi:hypothetical protein